MKINLEQFRELGGQLEVLRTYYARLTERERYIVLGSVAAGVLFLMLVIYSAFAATTSGLNSKIETSRENAKRIRKLQTMYSDTDRQIKQLEREIRRTPPGFQLATHLERLALSNGVKIDSIKDRAGPPNELYRETQVAVSVRQIGLRTLIKFLFEVENSRELMRISSLKVKPNFQDATQLNVTFVVSTFQSSGKT